MTELDLDLDCAGETELIERTIREQVRGDLRRSGVVLGVSGGVDSAVCLALSVRALGPQRVLGILSPDADTPPDAMARAKRLCAALGVEVVVEDIAPALDALGCYGRRDAAIRSVFPQYGDGFRSKITVGRHPLDDDRIAYFNLVIESPDGVQETRRLPADAYLAIVAATNMKQRTRKLVEYFHAERLNRAVLGTPNRLEYELGFFVRGGDGLADLKPIAHLYKSQVFQLAAWLGVPDEITSQIPSTETYSLPQTQEEFFFGLPLAHLDRLLLAFNQDVAENEAAEALGLDAVQVERAYRDISAKRRGSARTLRDALLVRSVMSTSHS